MIHFERSTTGGGASLLCVMPALRLVDCQRGHVSLGDREGLWMYCAAGEDRVVLSSLCVATSVCIEVVGGLIIGLLQLNNYRDVLIVVGLAHAGAVIFTSISYVFQGLVRWCW